MELVIFLHMEEIDCLGRDVPANSTVRSLLMRALQLRHAAGASGRNAAIFCDEHGGHELLDYARTKCPECVEKIERAFLIAELHTPA